MRQLRLSVLLLAVVGFTACAELTAPPAERPASLDVINFGPYADQLVGELAWTDDPCEGSTLFNFRRDANGGSTQRFLPCAPSDCAAPFTRYFRWWTATTDDPAYDGLLTIEAWRQVRCGEDEPPSARVSYGIRFFGEDSVQIGTSMWRRQ